MLSIRLHAGKIWQSYNRLYYLCSIMRVHEEGLCQEKVKGLYTPFLSCHACPLHAAY